MNTTLEEARSEIQQLREVAAVSGRKNDRLASALMAARQELAALHEEVARLTALPLNFATVLAVQKPERSADVWLGGRKMRVAIAQSVVASALEIGQEVRLNEHLVIIGVGEQIETGDIVQVKEVVDSSHVLAIIRNDEERVLALSEKLIHQPPRIGDALVADLRLAMAYRQITRPEIDELLLEEVPEVSYNDIGGLNEQIDHIRDAIELPVCHPELFRDFNLKPPRGVLLYGPPGCGKTLIAKAVARSLINLSGRNHLAEQDQAFFLNVKGPQLLNKYVGETERQIRLIFARAREKATQGVPVVIFFDEMDALFRTRGSGKSSDVETTVVPQLLAEIDGVEELDNVVIIGASNREDMLDPAILRPGRLDVKIRIDRPNQEQSEQIMSKYLTPDLPLSPQILAEAGSRAQACKLLIAQVVTLLYRRDQDHAFLELTYLSGQKRILYISDFISGAMLANIVDRAKKTAIKDYLSTGKLGLGREHLLAATAQEISENEQLLGATNPDEWSRVLGRRGERVKSLRIINAVGNEDLAEAISASTSGATP